MPRVVTAILGLLVIAGVLLLLRQQNLRLRHACNQLHGEMFEVEQTLWRQQVQVAAATSPSAVEAVRELHHQRQATAKREASTEWSVFASADDGDAW